MKQFEFRKHHDKAARYLPLNIAGHVFTLKVTQDVVTELMHFGKEAQCRAKELEQDENALPKAQKFAEETLNKLLGEERVNAIFAERERDLYDMIDVISYISEEISELCNRQMPQKPTT